MEFLEDIRPILMKLKRIWRAISELKLVNKELKLSESKKALTELIYALSDFEVSLSNDFSNKYPELEYDLVFEAICKEKIV